MMTCFLIYYFLRNCVMYCIRFSSSGLLYVGLSTAVEKRKTIKYCLIMENLPPLWSQLGHIYWEFLSLLLNLFFLIIFFGFFIIYFCGFFIYYYLLKTYVRGYIYYIKWDLKPPCQTRKSVRTDFRIWHKPCNALMEMKMFGTNFTSPSLFLVASPLVRAFSAQSSLLCREFT